MLLITLLELWLSGHSQAHGGAEQYYYMGERQTFNFVPIVDYETGNNWFIEGRYNYEALGTMSVYTGKTFEKKGAVSYSVSPIIGAVVGRYKGGSIGGNNEVNYKRYSFSSQVQYTFSLKDKTKNFFYSWSDFSYQPSTNLSAGFSIQQTNLYKEQCKLDKGVFVKASFSRWSIPLYVFTPATKERYFVLGLNCDW